MTVIPKDPNYSVRVIESFSKQKFINLIKAKLIKIEPGFCEIHVPFDASLTRQHGWFHYGILCTVGANADECAASSLIVESSSILTIDFTMNLISPADGHLLIGRSRVLKHEEGLIICRSDIFIVHGETEKLCAASQSMLIEVQNKK